MSEAPPTVTPTAPIGEPTQGGQDFAAANHRAGARGKGALAFGVGLA